MGDRKHPRCFQALCYELIRLGGTSGLQLGPASHQEQQAAWHRASMWFQALGLAVRLHQYTDTPAWLHCGVSEPVEHIPANAHAGYLAVTPVTTSKTLFLNLFISTSGRALY